MMYYLKISVVFLLFCSCANKNSTDAGEFWYKEVDMQGKTALMAGMINTYDLNGYFYLHIRTFLPIDDNEYYYGLSKLRNDTFFVDFYEKRKFDLTEVFDAEVEVSPHLVPCDIYFSSAVIPKTVCWKTTPLDSLSDFKQRSIHKFLK